MTKLLTVTLCTFMFVTAAKAGIPPGLVEQASLKGSDNHGKYNIKYVQLTAKAANAKVRAKVNAGLHAAAKGYICASNAKMKADMSAEMTTRVTLARTDLFGIEEQSEVYCGGAHPDGGVAPRLFELVTGTEVNFANQFANTAKLQSLSAGALATKARGKSADCKEVYTKGSLANAGYFYSIKGTTGVEVTLSLPHVAMACQDSAMVAFASLAPLLKAGSALSALMKGH